MAYIKYTRIGFHEPLNKPKIAAFRCIETYALCGFICH